MPNKQKNIVLNILVLLVLIINSVVLSASSIDIDEIYFNPILTFENAEPGDGIEELREKEIVGMSSSNNFNFEIVDGIFSTGNALKITPATGATGHIDIFVETQDHSVNKDAEALVFRFKGPKATDRSPQLMVLFMLFEGQNEDFDSVGEVWMYYHVYSQELGNSTTLIFIDNESNMYTEFSLQSPYAIPSEFDGWVIVPRSYFQKHPGYVYNDGNDLLDTDMVTRFMIEIQTPNEDDEYYFDNVGFTNSIEEFIDSLGSTPLPVDRTISMDKSSITAVDKENFDFIKENSKNLTININDGSYLEYSWMFSGEDITKPADFNPEIVFESEFEDEVNALYAEENLDAMYFTFSHEGDLPGKSVVNLYVGEKFSNQTTLYLYSFNEETELVELEKSNLQIDDLEFIEIEIENLKNYFLTTLQLEIFEPKAESDNNIILYAGIAIGIIIIAAILVIILKKKRR